MGLSWDESYVGQLRALAGPDRTLITMGARAVLRDDAGRVLLIKRSDNGLWAFPAGTMELGETMRGCAIREVLEETGLVVGAVTPFGLYTYLADRGPDMYGHTQQHVTLACRVDAYDGELVRVTDETTDAAFFPPDALPEGLSSSVAQSLSDLAAFEATGRFTLQ
jgi:ADP-ribose pyrophosphatase YjhB (NUDIX family)